MFDDLIDRLSDFLSSAAESAGDAFSNAVGGFFGGDDEPPEEPPIDDGSDYDEPDYERDKEEALEHNLHPREFEDKYGYEPGSDYTDELIQKLNLNGNWDDGNHTERSLYTPGEDDEGNPLTAYEQLVNYLESFNGGYPDDDLIEIELTDEGYQLYVAIDTP